MSKRSKRNRKNKIDKNINNGILGEAILGGSSALSGFRPFSEEVNNPATIFKHARAYLITNFRQYLSLAYVSIGLVKTICRMPVDDAFSTGFEIKTNDLSTDEIDELKKYMKEKGDVKELKNALTWARLFGGAGIIIDNNDKDRSKPLKVDELKKEMVKKVKFIAADQYELYHEYYNVRDDNKFDIDKDISKLKKMDELDDNLGDQFSYYGQRIHRSRVLKIKGDDAPSFVRHHLRGWGMSVLEPIMESVNIYLKGSSTIYEILDEFRVGIMKIKDLGSLGFSGDLASVKNRVNVALMEKNTKGTITMDAEDDFDYRSGQLSGIGESLDAVRSKLASDLRIPMNKLFGDSASGFANGEDAMENYNSMIEGSIREDAIDILQLMVRVRILQLFDLEPEDLKVTFNPLRILNADQMESKKNNIFNRVLSARQAGEIDDKDFKKMMNLEQLLPSEVKENNESHPLTEDLMDAKTVSDDNPKATS